MGVDAASGTFDGDPDAAEAAEQPPRNPQRDWAAPPPWLGSGGRRDRAPQAPGFLASRTKGSGADQAAAEVVGLAGSRWLQGIPDPAEGGDGATGADGAMDGVGATGADDGLGSRGEPYKAVPGSPDLGAAAPPAARRRSRSGRPGAQSTEPSGSRGSSGSSGLIVGSGTAAAGPRPRAASGAPPPGPGLPRAVRRPADRDPVAPAWERPRRFEAYPTLKTRVGWPNPPRLLLGVLALLIAAIVLFAAPFLVRFVTAPGGSAGATPTPTPLATSSAAPTDTPAPTPVVYVVVANDTMGRIAARFGLTVDQLLAANKQIKNPDKIAIGDRLVIPAAAPSEIINGASPSAGPSARPSASP